MREYLLGNVAIAKGILEAGAGVVSGYPGTPSSEIVVHLAPLAKEHGIHVEWSVNEKVAMEVAIGASWTGCRAAVTMKHVGLNVAADPFMTLAYLGIGGGMVVISADDPFCHSSQNEQDSRRYAAFARVPCLDPADPQEARDMTLRGFSLSEEFGLPVMLRPTTRISHARATVDLGSPVERKPSPGFEKNPPRRVALPVHARPLHAELLDKQAGIEEALAKEGWNRSQMRGEVGVIGSGIGGLYAEEAIAELEAHVSLLRIGAYPILRDTVGDFLEEVDRILVVEEMDPVLEEFVEMVAKERNPGVEILGKRSGTIPAVGELDPLTVRNAIARMMGLQQRVAPEMSREVLSILPPRPPSLCPGCSHRGAYYAMRKAFGRDAVFPNDIGCYTMGVGMGTVDTCLCMGASITVGAGIRFGGEERGICAVLGDSTFLHSGLTGLLNAAYNGARMTVAILDNSTTAMTGHQPHPGSGETAAGEESPAISIPDICRSLGAGYVETCDPYDLASMIETFERARDYPGLSVVVAKQACVISDIRAGIRRARLRVEEERCGGCKLCVGFGCPAIEFDGKVAKINALCSGCGVCAEICPQHAMEVAR
ncbi:indolepyruvate ferredoxin oxidoreductase subunit alpha [Candidatus Methanocrinis natronophilus]|uniref:Indolepyruvate oxidoreductase subunit IorA n=1 Tax=Candidatus Methanocrinis natronophilus TaxID=3033396 RepID=A0ABT5X8K6_9EURY|nr:indolepyruvate ferredoxin oxidoreductase subunit alpha [Candidatus Methanocrinis natronophilus]MDF0591017.1 indolepyruvate ferredoxin oxidoreductase subunit alpha [Candidatus Methanocrinis natronophilus]